MLLMQTRNNPVGPEGLRLDGEGIPQDVREGVAGALCPVHVHQLWASVPATPGLRRDSSPPPRSGRADPWVPSLIHELFVLVAGPEKFRVVLCEQCRTQPAGPL